MPTCLNQISFGRFLPFNCNTTVSIFLRGLKQLVESVKHFCVTLTIVGILGNVLLFFIKRAIAYC